MADPALCVLNSLLPGCGLLLRGRFLPGICLLLPALLVLSLTLVSASGYGEPVLPARLAIWGWGGYCLLVIGAALAWDALRFRRIDAGLVVTLYRSAATAYLRGELPAALAAARQLTMAAPREAGAWRLLALVATAHGSDGLATSAGHRAACLDNPLE